MTQSVTCAPVREPPGAYGGRSSVGYWHAGLGVGVTKLLGALPRGPARPRPADQETDPEHRDAAAGHDPPAGVAGIGEVRAERAVQGRDRRRPDDRDSQG